VDIASSTFVLTGIEVAGVSSPFILCCSVFLLIYLGGGQVALLAVRAATLLYNLYCILMVELGVGQ